MMMKKMDNQKTMNKIDGADVGLRKSRMRDLRSPTSIRFVFFGTAPLAIGVLDALEIAGFLPSLVVAGPDTVDSRKKTIVFPPEKIWALAHNIEVVQPQKLDPEFLDFLKTRTYNLEPSVFIVASYGKILPKALLDIPAHGTLNMHPSLLPRLRGPSPIRSAILNDEREIGVSIILLDDKMDHGPIIAQKKVVVPEYPPHGADLDILLALEGGAMLAEYLPRWVAGEIEPHPQNHDLATTCRMFKKEDGLIDLHADAYQNLLKIRAFEGWPGTYTFFSKGDQKIRTKILDAHIDEDMLRIDRVIPEGKHEMSYVEFLRSGAKPL